MKHLSSFVACAIAFAFAIAVPAGAQDSAFIQQVESSASTATIEQMASLGNNYATIDQVPGAYGGGNGNEARVWQNNVGDADARIYQSGDMNSYSIWQSNGQGLRAGINVFSADMGDSGGQSNNVRIDQSGIDSGAWVDVAGYSSFNQAEIMQSGAYNQAGIHQLYSSGNNASISQAGYGQQAAIDQRGGGSNVAIIRQGY